MKRLDAAQTPPDPSRRDRTGAGTAPRSPAERRSPSAALAAAALGALALTILAPAAQAQSGPEGLWRTQGGKGLVEIRACEDRLCGYAASPFALPTAPETVGGPESSGEVIFTHFIGGPVVWREGLIRDPRSGRAYAGRLRLIDERSLKVTGCLTGPLCASQVWTRVR